MSLRGRIAAVAIFKPKVWHPAPKHGSTKQEGIPITKTWIHCFILLSLSSFQGSVSFRATIVRSGMASRFVKDCRVGRTRPPRNDTKLAGLMKKPASFLHQNVLTGRGATPRRRLLGSAMSRGRRPAFPVRSIFHTIEKSYYIAF